MKKRITTMLLLACALVSAGSLYATAPEDIVHNMFNEVLKRNPTPEEFDRYMDLVIENGWDNSDLKRVLRKKKADAMDREIYGDDSYRYDYDHDDGEHYDRDYDYDSDRGRNDRRYSDRKYYEKRRWVEHSFGEYLGRLPNRREMNKYCDVCLDENYSRHELERRIRDDFRDEPRRHGRDHGYYDYDRYSHDDEVEIIIEDAFKDIYGQSADEQSIRKYRRLMIDRGWSERRVREDIADHPQLVWDDLKPIVIRAYEDLLDRTPSIPERDGYVEDMIKHRWDERKLRKMIKKSREYQYERPRKLVQKAYKELMLREPDPSAYSLTREIAKRDWDLEDVKDHLRKSHEYRTVTIPKIINKVYREFLYREPDPYGMNFYTQRLLEGWTIEELESYFKRSDEYKKKHP